MVRPALDRYQLLELYREYLLELRHRGPDAWKDARHTLIAFWDHAGKDPGRCRPGDLHRFLTRRTTPGGNSRGMRLADSTRATYAERITRFYRIAYGRRWLTSNPMRDVAPPPRHLGPPRALLLADVARLLEHVATDPRLSLLVWLAYGCGLRCMELAVLRREHLQLGERPHLIVVSGKGGRSRLIPLNAHVATVLRAALADGPTVGPVISSLTMPGRHLQAKTVSMVLSHALRDAGVTASAHQLRHTFATELLAAGKGRNLRAVQHLLGHVSVSTTERYVSAYHQDAWDTVALLPDPRGPATDHHQRHDSHPAADDPPTPATPATATGREHAAELDDDQGDVDRVQEPPSKLEQARGPGQLAAAARNP